MGSCFAFALALDEDGGVAAKAMVEQAIAVASTVERIENLRIGTSSVGWWRGMVTDLRNAFAKCVMPPVAVWRVVGLMSRFVRKALRNYRNARTGRALTRSIWDDVKPADMT